MMEATVVVTVQLAVVEVVELELPVVMQTVVLQLELEE